MQVSGRQEADPAWQQLPFRATNLGGALLSWIPSRYIFSNLLPHGSNFQFADTAVDIFLFKSVFKQVKCIFNELWCCCFCHQCSLIKPVITQVTFSHLSMRICWRLQFTTSGVKSGVNQDLEEHCGNVSPFCPSLPHVSDKDDKIILLRIFLGVVNICDKISTVTFLDNWIWIRFVAKTSKQWVQFWSVSKA